MELSALYLLELILRGACAGMLLLLATHFVRSKEFMGLAHLAALFAIGTSAYVLVSSPVTTGLGDPIRLGLAAFATLNSVFFWWFATALFDDEFRWKAWRTVPFFGFLGLYIARIFAPGLLDGFYDDIVQQIVIIAMMLHSVWLAIAHRRDDLVEPRRSFRLLFAGLIGVTGIVIAIVELSLANAVAPMWLTLLHAIAVFVLTLSFTHWLVRPVDIFSLNTQKPQTDEASADFDSVIFKRLEDAMADGIYKHEALSIPQLADHIAYPEYKLRRLINGAMGYRNFNAFINHYRIAEAKTLLSDPNQARMQVTQIAFELGYGSIAPFNRAFKANENMTPREYRKRNLKSQSGTQT